MELSRGRAGDRRVLVTRPEPDASRTAERLAREGFTPLALPLSRTHALPHEGPPGAEGFDAVAATSANALRFAGPDLPAALRAKPIFVVGPHTADAARRAGFADVREGEGDAARLARLVLDAKRRAVLFLCGRVRRPDFETWLVRNGVEVAAVETYDTETLVPPPERLAGLGPAPVDAALVYSLAAARALAAVLRGDSGSAPFADTTVLALSPRIAAELSPLRPALAAAEPNEDALFALLGEWARG